MQQLYQWVIAMWQILIRKPHAYQFSPRHFNAPGVTPCDGVTGYTLPSAAGGHGIARNYTTWQLRRGLLYLNFFDSDHTIINIERGWPSLNRFLPIFPGPLFFFPGSLFFFFSGPFFFFSRVVIFFFFRFSFSLAIRRQVRNIQRPVPGGTTMAKDPSITNCNNKYQDNRSKKRSIKTRRPWFARSAPQTQIRHASALWLGNIRAKRENRPLHSHPNGRTRMWGRIVLRKVAILSLAPGTSDRQ